MDASAEGRAVGILVSGSLVLFAAAAVRVAVHAFTTAPLILKQRLELILCRRRENKQPITVSEREVWLVYVASAAFLLACLTSWIVFFIEFALLASTEESSKSLFSYIGEGNGLGISSLCMFFAVLLASVALSFRSVKIVRELFLDGDFRKLVAEHAKSVLQKPKPTGDIPLLSIQS